MRRGKFEPRGQGVLAIEPKAFGWFFDLPDPPKVELRSGVALVPVRGPLMHHEDWLFDSYDAIGMRMLEALEQKPRAIVMSIDSPGGLVAGCFEMAEQLRQLCAEAGVPLYAYVDGQCTSAAYALACAAEQIVTPMSGTLGSVGVLAEVLDLTAAAEKWGEKITLLSSGARKTDGHPMTPLTDEARAALQAQVDTQALVFFEHVAKARGLSVAAVAGWQAAIFTGANAVRAGLADQVGTLEGFLAAIASGNVPDKTQEKTMTTKASKGYEDAIATLRKVAEGDDEEAAKAKRMLKAELDEAPAEEKKDDPAPAPEEGKAADAATALVKRVEQAAADAATAKVTAEAAARAAVEAERTQLLASRPDLAPELAAVMRKASTPIETVRDVVATHPRGKVPVPAAAAQVAGTRGEGQGTPGAGGSKGEPHPADVAMGLVKPSAAIHYASGSLVFPVMSPEAAAKALAEREKAKVATE